MSISVFRERDRLGGEVPGLPSFTRGETAEKLLRPTRSSSPACGLTALALLGVTKAGPVPFDRLGRPYLSSKSRWLRP